MIEINKWIEKRVMSFVDGEGSFISKVFGKVLADKTEIGNKFSLFIPKAGNLVRASAEQEPTPNLSGKIFTRIENEKRAAKYLGSRGYSLETKTGDNRYAWYGVSFVTACLAAFLITTRDGTNSAQVANNTTSTKNTNIEYVANKNNIDNASSTHYGYREPKILSSGLPTTMEVDWMRSDGRVSMVPTKRQSSPIIWIRKPRNSNLRNR